MRLLIYYLIMCFATSLIYFTLLKQDSDVDCKYLFFCCILIGMIWPCVWLAGIIRILIYAIEKLICD